jgi:hypothetical protein
VCLKVKSVGKPDAVVPHVRFDERGRETGLYATAPVLDSTVLLSEFSLISISLPEKIPVCFDKRIK